MIVSKKILVALLIISLTLTMLSPVSVMAADKTTQEKAQVLNTLKIISGANGQFNLDNKVSRAEAVTFIVKLIGRGNDVTVNADRYKITPFTDVPPNQWYAPYIGFCKANGFISQAGSEFKPVDPVTEKDFLKLVLIALDYKEGTDFSNDTIYDKARELGLISLNAYVGHINATINPTRGDVVTIMYTALTAGCRDGGKLCQKLIDGGVTTRLELMALGLLTDTTELAINQVKITGPDSIELKMTEDLNATSGIRIFSKDNENETLVGSIHSVSGSTVDVIVTGIEINKEYVVELVNAIDTEGNRTGILRMDFIGSAPEEVVSDFFRIRKIEPVNASSIKVYFTHPVTINSEVCLYYSVLKDNTVLADGRQGGIKAGVLNSDKTGVLLTFNGNIFTNGDLYTLKIDGSMMSAYGVKLNDGYGDSMKFAAKSAADEKFALVKVAALDKNNLQISFNKEVNTFLALQIFNFYLTDASSTPIRIVGTSVDPNGKSVYVNLGQDLTKGTKYNLTVNNLNDVTKQEYITEETYPFTANFGNPVKFKVENVRALDSQTVELTFNKVLDESVAGDVENYVVQSNGIYTMPDRVLYDIGSNPYGMTIYFSASNCLSSRRYELQLNGLKDSLGNSLDNVRATFSGTGKGKESIGISNVAAISTDAVKMTLTREMAYNITNLKPSNYTLEYTKNNIAIKKIPVFVLYVDAKTLIIKFDALEYDTPYKLKASSLTDYSGTISKGQEKAFQLVKDR